MESVLSDFLSELNDDELSSMFPSGNKTPGAAYLRYRAYIGNATTGGQMMKEILKVKEDKGFQSKVGHKRGALIVCIAICVLATKAKGLRPLTDKMEIMISKSFDEDFMSTFISLLKKPMDRKMKWKKDGKERSIDVCKSVAEDVELIKWADSAWAPLRD